MLGRIKQRKGVTFWVHGALVDHAAQIASKRVTVGYGDKVGTASQRWTKTFASEMDRLSEQLGL
jgi:hypothetical protein